MSLVERTFSALVSLLPDDVAAEYAADMTATFSRRLEDARRRRVAGVLWFAARELAGLARLVVVERVAARRRGAPAPSSPRPKPNRMSNLAMETRHAVG